MKVLVTGSNGMVARATTAYCRAVGDDVVTKSREELDISDLRSVFDVFDREGIDAVINCAAFTDVDASESDPETCLAANATGPENLAKASRAFGSKLVTISTDYVFDGCKSAPYVEDDPPNPLGVYGKSKLEGEKLVLAAYPRSIVVRTGWIYGPGGRNFLSVLPSLLRDGKKVKAIRDCFGTPTYSEDLARRLRELASSPASGIFNVTNEGEGTSYAGFAEKVCDVLGVGRSLLEYADAETLKRPAPRPMDSRLRCARAAEIGLSPLPDWDEALQRFLENV